MNDENDEGHFDDDGNFIWNKEDTRVQEEAWLDGVSQEQIGAALHAKVWRVLLVCMKLVHTAHHICLVCVCIIE